MLVGIFHAGLGEGAGHQAGAEDPLDRPDRAVSPGRLVWLVLLSWLGTEQAELAHLLQSDRKADACLASLYGPRGYAERGRARGAGVGHVVNRDAGLPNPLLAPLADPVPVVQAACRQDVRVEDRKAGIGQRGSRCLTAQVDEVLVL